MPFEGVDVASGSTARDAEADAGKRFRAVMPYKVQ
jgi:hypothetical protein